MPVEIIGCCDGAGENCRGWLCPAYNIAKRIARQRKGPSMPTGFGDANPVRHSDILRVVKEDGYDALLKSDQEPKKSLTDDDYEDPWWVN